MPTGHLDHLARDCQDWVPARDQARVAHVHPGRVPSWDLAGAGSRDRAAATVHGPVPSAHASPVHNRAGRAGAAPVPRSRHRPAHRFRARLPRSPLPSHLGCAAGPAQLPASQTAARPAAQRRHADAPNAPPGRSRPRCRLPARQPRRGHSGPPGSQPPSGQNPAVPHARRVRAAPPRHNGNQNATARTRPVQGALLAARQTSSAVPLPAQAAGVLDRAAASRAPSRAAPHQTAPRARLLGHRGCRAFARGALPGAVPVPSRHPYRVLTRIADGCLGPGPPAARSHPVLTEHTGHTTTATRSAAAAAGIAAAMTRHGRQRSPRDATTTGDRTRPNGPARAPQSSSRSAGHFHHLTWCTGSALPVSGNPAAGPRRKPGRIGII